MKYILITFVEHLECIYIGSSPIDTFSILSDRTIQYSYLDEYGFRKYSNISISDFEFSYIINIEELIIKHNLKFDI